MRLVWVSALFATVAVPAFAQPIPVPSDPIARYQALNVTRKPNGRVEILSRRDGPNGSTFSFREVDCQSGRRSRYLGTGDTREEAMRREAQNNTTLGPDFEESISWYVARFACRSTTR